MENLSTRLNNLSESATLAMAQMSRELQAKGINVLTESTITDTSCSINKKGRPFHYRKDDRKKSLLKNSLFDRVNTMLNPKH